MKIDLEVKRYLDRKKWSYSDKSASQYVVKVCPFCGDRRNKFYMNKATGQYICWICDEEGNLYGLKKALGDLVKIDRVIPSKAPKISKGKYLTLTQKTRGYHNSLKSNKIIKKLLKNEWGYSSESIKTFKLGLRRSGKVNWLVYPYFEDKKLVNLKYRTLPPTPKRFRREEGLKSALYNLDNVDMSKKSVFMVEGESDTITAHIELDLNVVGTTVGARGFKTEWIDFFDNFDKIYLVYDNDVAGQDGAKKMAFRLGSEKCYNVTLPKNEQDLTGWVMEGNGKKEFRRLIAGAEQFDVEDVVSFSSVLDDLESELYFHKKLDTFGLETPWSNVNKLISGFSPGDLIVLSGVAKIGKTTFSLNIATYQAFEKNIPSLLYCLEMRPERISPKVISSIRGVERRSITREDVIFIKAMYGRKPLHMAHSYRFTVDEVYETIRKSIKRYGIELLVFDHLHFLIRSVQNVSAEVSNTTRDFKLMAEEFRIPIILICQPTKLGKRTKMTTNDLRDSSSIGQDADTVIIVHRERLPEIPGTKKEKSNRPLYASDAEIIVDATRWDTGGVANLRFNGAISKYFKDKTEERRFFDGGVRS